MLQQLESDTGPGHLSVNDAFKPVSRYWDRINRPDQLICSVVEAMRVLTSPAQTGAVTLALPQDVQAEAFDYPVKRCSRSASGTSRAPNPSAPCSPRAAEMIRSSRKRPFIVAGGGVLYSEATQALARFVRANRHSRSAKRKAGKGSLRVRPPAEPRRRRRHRHTRRQHRRARGRPRHRPRHAPQRFHHRIQRPRSRTPTSASSTSTSPSSTPSSTPACRSSPTPAKRSSNWPRR